MENDDLNTLGQEAGTPIEAENETDVVETEGDEPQGFDPDDANDETDDGSEGEEGAPELEYAEIEINGKKYHVPAEIKDGYLKNADYTRKTQEVAEQRRQIEAEAARVQQMAQVTEAEINLRAELIGITQRLEQYKALDWQALEEQDPVGANRAWREYQTLKDEAGQKAGQFQQMQAYRTQQTQQEYATRIEQTREFAQKNIPGWTPEVDERVTQFALEHFSPDELAGAINPKVYQMLYLASLGAQSMQKATAKPSAARPQQSNIKPLAMVSSKATGMSTKDPASMSMDDYAKWAARKFK